MKSPSVCLTQDFRQNLRCDRCDLPIVLRTWKDEIIALSTSRNKHHGFICVRCVLSPKIGCTFQCTEEQLDEFVKSQCTKNSRGVLKEKEEKKIV